MRRWSPPSIDARTGPVRIISCDVFDTLLLRNRTAETNRVRIVAERMAAMLARERGIAIGVDALWRARIEVQRSAYRALDMLHPTGEVRFARMIGAMARMLGMGESETGILTAAEIAVEETQLSPNVALLAWLETRAALGMRIVAISDTWHEGATIARLLDRVAPGHPVARVYTSADLDATKRTAALYSRVAADEDVATAAFLHIGDDRRADDVMARRAGLRVHRIRVPRATMLGRRIDGATARLRRTMPDR